MQTFSLTYSIKTTELCIRLKYYLHIVGVYLSAKIVFKPLDKLTKI
jgi:hypothetical protein